MDNATKELTLSVPEAGRKLGLGRDASYEAARRGELIRAAVQADIQATLNDLAKE